jgi:hypothetical protein
MLAGDRNLKPTLQANTRKDNNVDEHRCPLECDILSSGRNWNFSEEPSSPVVWVQVAYYSDTRCRVAVSAAMKAQY